MSRFVVFGVVAALALALVLFLTIRDDGPAPTADPGSVSAVSATSSTSGAPSASAGSAKPTLPPPIRMPGSEASGAGPANSVAAQDELSAAFEGEAKEPMWAQAHAELIHNVVDELVLGDVGGGQLVDVDCRSRHCRLRLEGERENELVALIDALQDDRGFLGKAESMSLSRDKDSILVFLRFPAEAGAEATDEEPAPDR